MQNDTMTSKQKQFLSFFANICESCFLVYFFTDKLMVIWQGVAMDSLKFHPDAPCPTLLSPVGQSPLKRLYSHFRSGPPTGRASYGRLLPLWTPHAVHLWSGCIFFTFIAFSQGYNMGPIADVAPLSG
jgi:hypothetical protein